MSARSARPLWFGLLFVLSLVFGGRAGAGELLRIKGNWVLNDEVYRAVLELPPGAQADRDTARLVRQQLRTFLRRSGYVLARVRARVDGDQVVVELDEGRLEKIVFLGCGTLRALQLKAALNLPQHVFNRPYLERQLDVLSRKFDLREVSYRLVPVRPVKHHGPQLDELGVVAGHAVVPPGSRYELHIQLGSVDWDVGLELDLGYDFPDGLDLGAYYRSEGLLFAGDRWRAGGRVGGKLRERIDGGEYYAALSRAQLDGQWFTPSLIGRGLRPFLSFVSDLVSRQRRDRMFEIYYAERLEGSLHLSLEPVPGLLLSAGGGVEHKWIFGGQGAGDPPASVPEGASLRPFVGGRIDWQLGQRGIRRDRRHAVWLEARHLWVDGSDSLGQTRLGWRKVFELGWHDLVVGVRGAYLWGAVGFDDEEPVGGRHLRGVFGDRYWVRRVGSLVLEFRLSLARDLYKVGVFHDLAFFGQPDLAGGPETFRVADSFGLGFHALILDLFQLDLYYAFGFSSEGADFDHGLSASLTKVF